MNWTDLAVVAIILAFAFIGLSNGFIFSMFRLASFFISVFVSVKCYPLVSKILMKTAIDDNIQRSIKNTLMVQQQTKTPGVDHQVKQAAADSVINSLQLPSFIKDDLVKYIPNPSKIVPVDGIVNAISVRLTAVVIDIISLVILYFAIRIGLIFLRFVFKGIAKLPVFKQIDKVGGLAFGAVEGLLSVYILMAVLMLFNAAPKFKAVFEAVNTSVVAKFFYQNNFIINWMFNK